MALISGPTADLHGGFVAGDAQREEQHIDDQGENDDGPAPVGNVFVQPLEHVEDRVGDEFHPAKIYEAVERRIHVLQLVVIFGTDVHAQCEGLRAGCGSDFWNGFRARLAVDLSRMKIFPVAGLQRAGSGAVRREKRGGEVAVFYAGEIFAALPDSGTPVIEAFEFFVWENGDFSVFAVEGVDGFDGRGIGDGEVAESA